MRVGVTGCNGLLGSTICRLGSSFGVEPVKLSRECYGLENSLSLVCEYIRKMDVSVVVHCAANTNVELCEQEITECFKDNYLLTELLANACKITDKKLVYISSTGVYGNYQEDPYREFDDIRPTTNHHKSKRMGELVVCDLLQDYLVVRTGWLFGGDWSMPKNFVANRVREAKKCDGLIKSDCGQVGNPTYVDDLAQRVFMLIDSSWSGVFNCVNEGIASRFEYVGKIISLYGLDVKVEPVESSSFNRMAKVSHNESAVNFKLNAYGFTPMPEWAASLSRYIEFNR
ncbi:MAG: dTDP-4-dehydrorhamnose reductase [Candidatus Latescibacterota bacterium]|jgi:dTDP-4-dehydrorhamnose reductase